MIIDLFVKAKSRHEICCSTIYFLFEKKKPPQNLQIIHLFKKNPYEDFILLRNTSSRSFYLFTSNIFMFCFH